MMPETTSASGIRVPMLDLTAMHRDVRLGLEDVWRTALDTSMFIGDGL